MIQVHVYFTSNLAKLQYSANFWTLADAEEFAASINRDAFKFARVYA
jgi:hypothetical protein